MAHQPDAHLCEASNPSLDACPTIIVPYRNAHESLGSLRWAIRESVATGLQLVVVHQASIGVAVLNGPSAAMAHKLGNPTWATMFSVVQGLGAPPATVTIVESTPSHELIERYLTPGSRIVVAGSLHGRKIRRLLGRNVDIVRKPKGWAAPLVSSTMLDGDLASA